MKTYNLLVLCILSAALLSGCEAGLKRQAENLDSEIEKQIDEFLRKMTLEEKVGQMTQPGKHGEDGPSDIENEVRKGRVGSFLNITDIKQRNHLQKIAVEQTRLGIPLIFAFDVIHGYRTIFPVPLAEATSWDIELIERTAEIAAKEARAAGIDWTFSPMIDIARDPRWGRIVEGAGEDPYLGSLIARAKVRGYQGNDYSDPERLAACLKHFAAYGAVQAGREYNTTEVSERVLRNVYLPPFKAGVKEGAATLMSGFNDLDGIPASGNSYILTDILRGEWGFDGLVVSDWRSVKQLIYHGQAKDEEAAGIIGASAGVDMEMVSRTYENLPRLVRQGKFPEEVIDQAVRRILRIKIRAGLFDNPYADEKLGASVMLHPEHLKIAREMVRSSMVLLKNKGNHLPLSKGVKSIALIGPLADNRKDMLGTWAGIGKETDVVTVLEGIEQTVASDCIVHYAKGCDVLGDSKEDFAEAIEAARQSEVVIMAMGESVELNGEGHSRTSLDLPGVQRELIQEIYKTGKPVVVLLFTGRPLTINWVYENIPVILIAWHPGIQAGTGIADVIFGDYNPSGKLTVTFPRNVGQIPIYYNAKNTGRPPDANDRWTSKYIDVPWTPLISFGYGLSYTVFEYSNLQIAKTKVVLDEPILIKADVTNTGNRAGQEVVQLYIRDLVGSVTRPVKELKGFKKIFLNPGETKTVTFNLSQDNLKFYDRQMNFVVEPGEFKVWVGPNSAEGLESGFEIVE